MKKQWGIITIVYVLQHQCFLEKGISRASLPQKRRRLQPEEDHLLFWCIASSVLFWKILSPVSMAEIHLDEFQPLTQETKSVTSLSQKRRRLQPPSLLTYLIIQFCFDRFCLLCRWPKFIHMYFSHRHRRQNLSKQNWMMRYVKREGDLPQVVTCFSFEVRKLKICFDGFCLYVHSALMLCINTTHNA